MSETFSFSDLYCIFEDTFRKIEENMIVAEDFERLERLKSGYPIMEIAIDDLEVSLEDGKFDNDSYNILYGVIWTLYATSFIEKSVFKNMLHNLEYFKEQADKQADKQ